MKFQKGQSGNPGGKVSDKPWSDAIRMALQEAMTDKDGKAIKKLRIAATSLVDKAISGDVPAMKEIGDRLEGRPAQATVITGDLEHPLKQILEVTFKSGV